jgi:hypothetical protein
MSDNTPAIIGNSYVMPNYEGLYLQATKGLRQAQAVAGIQQVVSSLTSNGPNKGLDVGSSAFALLASQVNSTTLNQISTLVSGVNSFAQISGARNPVAVQVGAITPGAKTAPDGTHYKVKNEVLPGRVPGLLGAGFSTVGSLTNNRFLSAAGNVSTGVSSTLDAIKFGGSTAGAFTAAGAAAGAVSLFMPGNKAVNVAATALSTAGSIASKATTLTGGLVGGVPGIVGTLIGGEAGQKVSALGSIAGGVMAMAANPLLGAVSLIGGLMGLFNKKPRVSKLSSQSRGDFKGVGQAVDVVTRAPKGKNNDLQISLADLSGKLHKSQTLKIGGWFDKKSQANQEQAVDLNGDGKQEIVWQDKNRISVFMNRGDGTFGNQEFAAERAKRVKEGDGIRMWGQLIDGLQAALVTHKPRNGDGDDYNPLEQVFHHSGSYAKLGDPRDWTNRILKEANLVKLKKEFDTNKPPTDFIHFVTDKLRQLGVELPEQGLLDRFLGGLSAEEKVLNTKITRYQYREDDGFEKPMSIGAKADLFARNEVAALENQHLGANGRKRDQRSTGDGVAKSTQTFDINIDAQKPGQFHFWDVNGDGKQDLVFGGDNVQGAKAFLGAGDGTFQNDKSIDLMDPSKDMEKLIFTDPKTNALSINADLNGTGERLQAVNYGQGWQEVNAAPAKA